MPGAGGEESVSAPAASGVDPIAWAGEVFAPFKLAWKEAPAKKGAVRVLGKTADEQALVDVTIRAGKVIAASAVVPIKPEYTPMLTFLLAVLVESATRQEADAWLARGLDTLKRSQPSDMTRPWHQWRVTLTTNALGLLTMQVRSTGARFDTMQISSDTSTRFQVVTIEDPFRVRK